MLAHYRAELSGRCVEPHEEIGPVVLTPTAEFPRHRFALTGGTIDFGETIDWLAAAENDLEWTCSLSRHPHLPVLARTYATTGEERFAREVVSQMLDWIARVPRIEPESMDYLDIKRSNWRPMEVALRIAEHWPQALKHVIGSEAMTPDAWATILASIHDQTDYLRRYRWDHGNHAFIEASALACVGLLFPEFNDADDWFAEGLEFLQSHWAEEFYPDGYTREMSGGYHWICYRGHYALYEQACHLGSQDRFRAEYVERLCQNVWAELYQLKPDFTTPMTNDSAWQPSRKAILRRAAKTLGLPEIEEIVGRATCCTRNDKRISRATSCTPYTSYVFPDANLVTFRDGWDAEARYLFFDAGAPGIAHQNTDQLCVEVSAFGRNLICNSGRFRYLTSPESPWRDKAAYFRSTASTSSVLVDGMNQKPGDARLLDTDLDGEVQYARGEFAAGYGTDENPQSARHRREVFFARGDFWIVRDTITFEGTHRAEQVWNLAPGAVVLDETNLLAHTRFDDANVILRCLGDGDITMRFYEGGETPCRGWAAVEYGRAVPRPQVCFEQSGESKLVFHTLIFPIPGKVRRLPQFERTNDGYSVTFEGKRMMV
ncbi:MAG: alginate lyase family protein [Phycisphaerae bacterium]|nr:alginate lyase family protein [Phycisphaerae bacterium]